MNVFGSIYFPCFVAQNVLQKLITTTKSYHSHEYKIKPIDFKPNLRSNVMEVVALHNFPQFTTKCCQLLNSEWKRSETARLRSLETSCDDLPTSLILVKESDVIGHSKLSVVPSMNDACFLESVIIDKEQRGKGYGKYLMKRVEEYCRSIDLKIIYLSTKDKTEFYAQLGYVICEPVSIYGQYIKNISSNGNGNPTNIPKTSINASRSLSSGPPPPPLPQDLYIGVNCKQKVFMSKVLN